jgi:hypothetical protein
MRAVTGLRRFPIIAIAALLAAGCGATPPATSPPASLGAISPPPASTPPAASPTATSPAPAASPDSDCPPWTEGVYTPSDEFEIGTPLGFHSLAFDFTRITSNADPAEFLESEAGKPYLGEPGRLVGNWEIAVHPGIDYEPVDVAITLGAARAVLRVDGREPHPMDGVLAPDGQSFLFDLPNASGSGRIDVSVEFSDECFTYQAEGAWAFEMVTAAYAAQCPGSHKGVSAHWADMQEPPVAVGGVAMPLFRSTTIGKWTRYATFVDPVVGWAQWDPASGTVTGQAGTTLPVVMGDADLILESLRIEFYRRSSIREVLGGGSYSNRGDVLFRASADPYADGHFELLLPSKPGRYVASVYFTYETACLSGDGAGGVAIDVE